MKRLSEHDKAVLDVIFDPLQLMGSSRYSPDDDDTKESLEYSTVREVELSEEVAETLRRAIEVSESGRFDEALALFDDARTKAPQSAAILNDRAQALRLVGRNDEALKDLELAVELSEGRGNAGIKALCQRGVMHRSAGRYDEAKRDFEAAARGGSSFARSQLVNINPYAAMCNAMLRDAMANSSII